MNPYNDGSSLDNLTEMMKEKNDIQDEFLKKFNKLTIYTNSLQELCDSLQFKKLCLDQLGKNIELADKLTNDLAIPPELCKYHDHCYVFSFIETKQFSSEYQDKIIALDERLRMAEVLKNEGFACASEVHIHLKRLSKTVSQNVRPILGL